MPLPMAAHNENHFVPVPVPLDFNQEQHNEAAGAMLIKPVPIPAPLDFNNLDIAGNGVNNMMEEEMKGEYHQP